MDGDYLVVNALVSHGRDANGVISSLISSESDYPHQCRARRLFAEVRLLGSKQSAHRCKRD
jgi:hypothetical protein